MSKNTNLSFLTDYITADITNGRIGINNASPTVAFDVSGATKISGVLTLTGALTGTTATFSDTISITANNSNAYSLNLLGRSVDNATTLNFFSNNGVTRYGYIYTEPTTMLFGVSGATRLAIASTGAATFSSSAAGYGITLNHTSENLRLKMGAIAGGVINIQGEVISSSAVYPIVLNYLGGNVGIGTTTIPSKLTVDTGLVTGAGQWASTAIAIYNPTNIGAYSQISFGYTTSTTNAAAYIGFISTNQGSNGFGDLVFGTRSVNTDTQPSEKMRILSGGNVGIGETNPTSYKLQVGGTVFANSFLSQFGYSYPTVNVWTTFYTMAAERGIYSVMIGLGSESFAEWQSYGVAFCQGSTGVFSTLYNSSLVQMRLSGLDIQVLLATGAGFTRELTFKVLRS